MQSGTKSATPPGPRVREGGAHAGAEVVLGREVHHGVVHEDDVERAPEPERPHVAEHVLAAGVERRG